MCFQEWIQPICLHQRHSATTRTTVTTSGSSRSSSRTTTIVLLIWGNKPIRSISHQVFWWTTSFIISVVDYETLQNVVSLLLKEREQKYPVEPTKHYIDFSKNSWYIFFSFLDVLGTGTIRVSWSPSTTTIPESIPVSVLFYF